MFSTGYNLLIVFKFHKENLFLPRQLGYIWQKGLVGFSAGGYCLLISSQLQGLCWQPDPGPPHSRHKNFTPWSGTVQTLKDCIDWSLPEISSSTVIVLEFKVCHDSKVLKKDLHRSKCQPVFSPSLISGKAFRFHHWMWWLPYGFCRYLYEFKDVTFYLYFTKLIYSVEFCQMLILNLLWW